MSSQVIALCPNLLYNPMHQAMRGLCCDKHSAFRLCLSENITATRLYRSSRFLGYPFLVQRRSKVFCKDLFTFLPIQNGGRFLDFS